jgi:hypothetical protein
MQALFRNAIQNLPTMERLVITLAYSEDLYDKSISLILEVPESTVSNIRKSAFLCLRASLPNPELGDNLPVRGLSRPGGSDASALARASTQVRFGNGADVRVHARQDRSLASGQNWDYLGDRATWHRSFSSWYLLDDDNKLRQISRVEHFSLDLEL